MKKDFLILYELKNRELENAALIATELRSRGYSVDICYINSKKYFNDYRVFITPNLANDNDVFFVLSSAKKMPKKVILMKQEQALSINGEKAGWGIPIETAKNAHAIAWGQSMADRLISNGIHQSHIHKIGSVALDFNHNTFDRYFYSREYICEKYDIHMHKHIHLFISSFSHCNLDRYYIEHLKNIDKDTERQIEIAEKSQKTLLEWFENAAETYKDIVFVYRPHPAEIVGEKVYALERRFHNFIINKDYSIRQWIRVVDSISLWYSTSIADIAYAGKKCMIVRPYDYPDDIDELALRNAKYIKTYDEFKAGLDNPESLEFPVQEKLIHYYFGDDFDGKSYIRFADVCEAVLNSSENIDYKNMISIKSNYRRKVRLIKLFCKICEYINVTFFLPEKYRDYFMRLNNEQKGYKKIFNEYCKRLERTI